MPCLPFAIYSLQVSKSYLVYNGDPMALSEAIDIINFKPIDDVFDT
jgi:hypothetical protein